MSRFGESDIRGPVLLDTGPLLTRIAFRYLDEIDASPSKRNNVFRSIRHGLFAVTEQERFEQLMKSFERPLRTTPHVLVEVSRLREWSELKPDQERFRNACLGLTAEGLIRDVPCSAQELCNTEFRDLASRFGITDAGLVYAANRDGCLLLTDEKPLFRAVQAGMNVNIRLLDHLL